jgi:hypothetical protein
VLFSASLSGDARRLSLHNGEHRFPTIDLLFIEYSSLNPNVVSILWLRDLTAMRVQLSQALHKGIVDRYESEFASQIEEAGPDLRYYLESLRSLKEESEERYLVSVREMALRVVSDDQTFSLKTQRADD